MASLFRDGAGRSSVQRNRHYVDRGPSAQQTVDLFAGVWSSRLPLADVESGEVDLFADPRIQWLIDTLGGVAGWRILELGPLEGGHGYMLEKAGADEIVAIDANKSAYLRCLVVKELLQLRKSRFLLGDFDEALGATSDRFDLIVASGVLYHLRDPLRTLQQLMARTDRLFVWGHFVDDAAMPPGDRRRRRLTGETERREIDDDVLTYHVRSYGVGTGKPQFCGGSHSRAVWLDRHEVVALLDRHGFDVVTAFDEPSHVNGPAVCLLAVRRGAVPQVAASAEAPALTTPQPGRGSLAQLGRRWSTLTASLGFRHGPRR